MFESIMPKMKVCRTCGVEKSEDEFHKRRDRNGNMTRRASCRSCFLKSIGKPGKKTRPS